MAKVVLVSTSTRNFSVEDINKSVTRALELLNFGFNCKIEKVVIKPNLCYYWDWSTGETTDPRVVAATIDYVRERLGKKANILVAEADASAMRTKYCFGVLGYEKSCREKNVGLINMSEGDVIERKVVVEDKELTLPMNRVLLDADLVINIPKLRTHNIVEMTCALKNMFGAIAKPRKFSYHNVLPYAIVGANKLVKSGICLVDGLVARGSHPRKLGVLIAGDDPLATDFVAARIMSLNPWKIQYLNMAEKEKIGDVSNIHLIEDNVKLKDVRNHFPGYNYLLHRISWSAQLKLLKTYARIVGDVIPPVLEQHGTS